MRQFALVLMLGVMLGCGDDENPCKGVTKSLNVGTCLDGGTGKEVRLCVDEALQTKQCMTGYCTQLSEQTFQCSVRPDAGS